MSSKKTKIEEEVETLKEEVKKINDEIIIMKNDLILCKNNINDIKIMLENLTKRPII